MAKSKKLKNEKPQAPLGTQIGRSDPDPSNMTLYGKHAKGDSKTRVGATRTMVVKAKKIGHNIDNMDGGHRSRYELKGVYDHTYGGKQKFDIYKK